MYSPSCNRIENHAEVLAFMRANNFVALVSAAGGAADPVASASARLMASHLPVLVEERGEREEQLVIVAHMAKSNPQWQSFFDDEVLVIFHGAHAYVSPRWYRDAERVPTWNYAAVHACGRVRALEGAAAKRAAVAKLVAHHDPQWQSAFERLSAQYIEGMLEAIVAFEIDVTRIETRWKLSQNRGREEMERIAVQLEGSCDAQARELAALTRRHLVAK